MGFWGFGVIPLAGFIEVGLVLDEPGNLINGELRRLELASVHINSKGY